MKRYIDSFVEGFMSDLIDKNPAEPEFHQAVHEVLLSLASFLEENPHYINSGILERMVEPERIIIFRVPWVNDVGKIIVNRGYRIEMNSAIGPYKGGLRFHPTVNLGILKFLAFEQVFKNSLTTLPLGGGKGGSDFDPKGKSDSEVMRFCQSFMTELYRHIGHNTDIPAGDIGVGGREIGYLFGQYKRITNEFTGTLTGKGVNWDGSYIRPEATGYGNVYFAEEMLNTRHESIKGKTVLISGSGNVAQFSAEKVNDLGGKVVTLSDSNGYIYDPNGIDKSKLKFVMQLKNIERGRIKEYAEKYNVKYVENETPWKEKADIALPSATQNEITKDDARSLIANGCICISEGANMPCTPKAIEIIIQNKLLYGPGKAANAGGVAVSGLEMSQDSMRLNWTREEVDARLKNIMKEIHKTCIKYGTKPGGYVNYMDGANIGGFVKVADTMIDLGTV
ncbi:NADP-specific glutamate dehydrogenase [Plebeiibacterium marinum]|uniref:Glutamate dehydrogenase n=1 Tax=Plebeiibacterium marinum TaxID=2992111 RepID=A0AAE3SL33_9BACT|nr:NADP-specific glutamate dehydrogenase [Plebeiobacterium marinum]MCW3807277.1 NADP-specific glutamate dehydrogenase [Plebeiobacterium marinum]